MSSFAAYRNRQTRFVFVCLAPILTFFIVFSFLPIFFSVILSFFNYNPLNRHPPFVGLKNYITMFKDDVFLKSMTNSFTFVLFAVSGNLVISTLVSLSLHRISRRWFKDLLRTFFYLPTIAPTVGAAIIWMVLLEPRVGIFKMILGVFGVDASVYWLQDKRLAMPSIIMMTLWQDIGANIIIIMAGLQAIPGYIYEAALTDGANGRQLFWRITLPLLVRTLLFVSVMTSIAYFQVFTQVSIMTRGGPDYATEVIALTITTNAFTYMKMGYASAMAVVLLLIILVVSRIETALIRTDFEY